VQARSGADDSGLNYTTITGLVTMWGQPISVEFQQRDLTLFTTGTSTSSSVSTSISTTAQPSNTIAQPYTSPTVTITPSSAPTSGLSVVATAGIAIAVAIGGFLILASVVFFFVRRRRAAKRQPYARQGAKPWERKELDGREIRHPVEMLASRRIIELE
jgi:hypothetical protein